MGTWSTLDTVLLVVALLGIAAATYFFVQSRRGTGNSRSVSLSQAPSVGSTENALRAAELADRLRIVHEHQAIVARELAQLVTRAEGSAFQSLENKSALQRHSKMLVQIAKSALTDMRRAMDVAGQGAESIDEWPTLESMTDLFAEAEENGLIINFEETGDRFAMSTSAELALLRILTEAINNARKHGGDGTEVDVLMTWTEHGLSVTLNDDGVRAAARRAEAAGDEAPEPVTIESDQAALIENTTGRGLLEMKSRASAFDGVIHTQRVPGVGFTVTASFPMIRHATDPSVSPETNS